MTTKSGTKDAATMCALCSSATNASALQCNGTTRVAGQ